jgi:para-nitrobenzyl esterase
MHNIPVLCGANADDGSIYAPRLRVRRPIGYRLFLRGIYREEALNVLSLFPANTVEQVQPALIDLLTVAGFAMPARFMARRVSRAGERSFLYYFTRVPATQTAERFGAFHALEIPYVFGTLPAPVAENPVDASLSEFIRAAWVQFAATGDPSVADMVEWPAYDPERDGCMILGDAPGYGDNEWAEASETLETLLLKRRCTDEDRE